MAYDPHDLSPHDPKSLVWAIAHARLFLRDTSDPLDYSQPEVAAMLEARAFVHDDVRYYRPHVTAASLIRSDPTRATQESIDNAQRTYRDVSAIAAGILREGAWIDDLIEAESGVRPRVGRSLVPVF